MAHYAKIIEGTVVEVIVADEDYISELEGTWVQTSYNSNIRKNYASVGGTYDSTRDAFIHPKPYPSWVLNETTCQWNAPVEIPDIENKYIWNEDITSWMLVEE
jgi:hypothetical protein